MTTKPNLIADCGLPLVYRIPGDAPPPCGVPQNRLGTAIRLSATSLAGFQKEARVSTRGIRAAWRMVSDEGVNLAGHDAAPPPLGYLSVGMIASYMNEISALARIRGVEIRDMRLTQQNYYSMTGSMPRKSMVGGALPVELTVEIACSLSGAALAQFLMDAVHAAPVNGLLRGALDSQFRLATNGIEIDPAGKSQPRQPLLPRFDPVSDESVPLSPVAPLLQPLGPSPDRRTVNSRASGTYSVKDAKAALIHVGASARYRRDGLKEIRQQLYAPQGTEWLFLSDEAQEKGGTGLAPDAESYIAAGIGFCYMTQFGILIDVHKLAIPEYQILQDLHLSPGGATGGTGQAGTADPVETHVHLSTGGGAKTGGGTGTGTAVACRAELLSACLVPGTPEGKAEGRGPGGRRLCVTKAPVAGGRCTG